MQSEGPHRGPSFSCTGQAVRAVPILRHEERVRVGAILEARNITKDFPGVRALDKVCFSLEEGQIHALCGENGAGKSTFINVLSGFFPSASYSGEILLDGTPTALSTIREAKKRGSR